MLGGTIVSDGAGDRVDPVVAGIVAVSNRAAKVAERAYELSHAGRDDARAVADLVAAAGDSKRTWENAERFSRQGARHGPQAA
jgi:hypothetical protein